MCGASSNEILTTILKQNRVTVPKEFIEGLKLEPPTLLKLTLSGVDSVWNSIEFYAKLRKNGQITIPVELFRELALKQGQTVFLKVQVERKQ